MKLNKVYGIGLTVGALSCVALIFHGGIGAEKQTHAAHRLHAEDRNPPDSGIKSSGSSTGGRSQRSAQPVNLAGFREDEFSLAWSSAIASARTDEIRLMNLSLVVGRMAKIADPAEILQAIQKDFGPGYSRCQLIGSLFMASTRTRELASVFGKLDFQDERDAACAGLSQQLCMVDSPRQIAGADYAYLGDAWNGVYKKALELYVGRFYSKPPEELNRAVGDVLGLEMPQSDRLALAVKLSADAPIQCWKELATEGATVPAADMKQVIQRMFSQDPVAAMEAVSRSPVAKDFLNEATQIWLARDARKPVEWLQSHSDDLPAGQANAIYQGIAGYSADHGDFQIAKEWLGRVDDPSTRSSSEERLSAAERQRVTKEASVNPQNVVASIVSGGSQYGDPSLEQAMNVWIKNDPKAAKMWSDGNWNNLPPDKRQFVAAAYASSASGSADLATARQWAEFIQDAQTRKRIDGEIAKAEETAKP